jgi:hypothetical protein
VTSRWEGLGSSSDCFQRICQFTCPFTLVPHAENQVPKRHSPPRLKPALQLNTKQCQNALQRVLRTIPRSNCELKLRTPSAGRRKTPWRGHARTALQWSLVYTSKAQGCRYLVGLTQSKLLLGEELVLPQFLDFAGEDLLRGRWDNVSSYP